MLQIPVFSLETDWREFTGSHYVDEFCEHHIKSIPVRDILTGSVPSAGVGCGFSRRALESELHTGSGPFNERSLTEDYDFATRLSLAGYSTRFLRPILARREMRERGLFRKRMEEVEREEIIATREYFPDELQPAIRQKSRWILGISIQGWRQIGWKGNFWMRYMLMRDRKTLMTSQVNVLGYVVLAGLAFLYLAGLLDPNEYVYPGLVESRTWLWYLILADTFFLIWRLILRAHCVYVVYGWTQAVWSAPRLVWGNFISFFATNRAIWLWLRSRLSGKPFQWEKTAHVFPTDETISSFRQRLGDLLLERRWVRVADLESALARQKTDPRLLGEILREMGVVEEEQIFQALALQWRLTSVAVDASATPLDALRLLPQKMAIQHRIYPLRLINGSRLQVAVDRLPPRAEMEQVEAALGRRLEFLLSTSSGLDRAIAQGYARLNGGNGAHA